MYAIWTLRLRGAEAAVAARHGGRRDHRLLRPDRARRRLRPGRDADPRQARRRPTGCSTGARCGSPTARWPTSPSSGRNTDEGIRGFVVPTDTPGFSRARDQAQVSLRASVTSELVLDEVRLPADARAARGHRAQGPLGCLNEARYGIVWGAMGAARSAFEAALELREGPRAVRPARSAASSSPRPSSPTWPSNCTRGILLACTSAGARTPAGCAPSRSASASSTTSARRSRSAARPGRSSAPTGSRWSTPSCGT